MGYWTSTTTKTVADVDRYVKRQFGDESGVQITSDDILRWVNNGQREIVSKNGLLRAESILNATPGVYKYTFPAEGVLKVQSLRYGNSALQYMSFQDFEQHIAANDPKRETNADPLVWTEWAGNIHLYPTPTMDGELALYYIMLPTELTSQSDTLSIPDRYYMRLVEYVMTQAYELDDDWTGVGNKQSQFDAGMNQLAEDESSPYMNTYASITVLPEDL